MSILAKAWTWLKGLASNKQKAINTAITVVDKAKVIANSAILQTIVAGTKTKADDAIVATTIKALNWSSIELHRIQDEDAKAIILNAVAALNAKYQGVGLTIQEGIVGVATEYNKELIK